MAWSFEPVDIYDHEGGRFSDSYDFFGGLVLVMECEWAQYGVAHDPDLRLRSMVKDFRKLVTKNAPYKLFIYCSIFPDEIGPQSHVLEFITKRVLVHNKPNGLYYCAEFRPDLGEPIMALHRYDETVHKFEEIYN